MQKRRFFLNFNSITTSPIWEERRISAGIWLGGCRGMARVWFILITAKRMPLDYDIVRP